MEFNVPERLIKWNEAWRDCMCSIGMKNAFKPNKEEK
jgi:hypothetical protein